MKEDDIFRNNSLPACCVGIQIQYICASNYNIFSHLSACLVIFLTSSLARGAWRTRCGWGFLSSKWRSPISLQMGFPWVSRPSDRMLTVRFRNPTQSYIIPYTDTRSRKNAQRKHGLNTLFIIYIGYGTCSSMQHGLTQHGKRLRLALPEAAVIDGTSCTCA